MNFDHILAFANKEKLALKKKQGKLMATPQKNTFLTALNLI